MTPSKRLLSTELSSLTMYPSSLVPESPALLSACDYAVGCGLHTRNVIRPYSTRGELAATSDFSAMPSSNNAPLAVLAPLTRLDG